MPKLLAIVVTIAVRLALAVVVAHAACASESRFIDPTDYGAVGDGTADDTAALQRTIAASIDSEHWMGTILLGRGRHYRISTSLRVAIARSGAIIGNGATLHWRGPADGTALFFSDARDITVNDLVIQADEALDTAIRSESGPDQEVATCLQFRGVRIDGLDGRLSVGFRAARGADGPTPGAGGDNNNEFHQFHDCDIVGYTHAGVRIEHSQAKHIRLLDTRFVSAPGASDSRCVDCISGSFTVQGGSGSGSGFADFSVEQPSDQMTVIGWTSSGSRRLAATAGPSGAGFALRIADSTFASDALADDRIAVDFRYGGPLQLENDVIGSGATRVPLVRLYCHLPCTASILGCDFGAAGSADEDPLVLLGNGPHHVEMAGNTFRDRAGARIGPVGTSIVGKYDASRARMTRPARVGTALPPGPRVGDLFFKVDAMPGSNLFLCASDGAWTQMAGARAGTTAAAFTMPTAVPVLSAAPPCPLRAIRIADDRFDGPAPSSAVAVHGVGDGMADDTAALQAALDAAIDPVTRHMRLVLFQQRARYRVTSTLHLANVAGGVILGNSARIEWSGGATSPLFALDEVHALRLQGLYIASDPRHRLATGIRLVNHAAPAAGPCDDVFRRVVFEGTDRGGLGVALDVRDDGADGVPHVLDNVEGRNYDDAFLRLNGTRRVHLIASGGWPAGGAPDSPSYGIDCRRGCFDLIASGQGYHAGADVFLGELTGPVTIVNINSEGSRRHLQTGPAIGTPYPVMIIGDRTTTHNEYPGWDWTVFDYSLAGPLTWVDSMFGQGTHIPRYRIGGSGGRVLVRGLAFDALDSQTVDPLLVSADAARDTTIGLSVAITAGGESAVPIGVRLYGAFDVAGGASTRPTGVGTTLPAAPTIGDAFFKADAVAGRNLFFCIADGAWTQMADGQPSAAVVVGAGASGGDNVASIDAARCWSSKPARIGTVLPAGARVGEWFLKLDAEPGRNLHFCTAPGTWTQMQSEVSIVLPPAPEDTGVDQGAVDAGGSRHRCGTGAGLAGMLLALHACRRRRR